MQTPSTNVVILSPGLSQSFAIANLLREHFPDYDLLGYRLPGEKGPVCRPFVRYIAPSEGEAAIKAGVAIMTGEASTQHAMRKRDSVRLGQIEFERRNLWFYDKAATLQLARQLDIPIPRTWTTLEEIGNYPGAIFCKPAFEGASGRRMKVRSPHNLPDSMFQNRFLFQEVIEGRSVIGFGFLADRGKIVAAKIHREILSCPLEGGSAVAVEAYQARRVEELAKRLIADFRYSGWGLVEFKPCPKRGDLVLMELNAKFWASLEFTLRSCPLFSYFLFGVQAKAEPIRRMIWPSRMLRNGLLRMPLQLRTLLPAVPSREALTWRDWARLVLPE